MALSAGICPKCNEHLLIKSGIPFLVCPLCGESMSARNAEAALEVLCSDPQKISENIAKCIKIEEKFGPQLPLQILKVMGEAFPHNEEVSYLTVKMSGFSPMAVKYYLVNFSTAKKIVPYAEDFLENTLTYRNMALADYFEQFILNRLAERRQDIWLEKLKEMRLSFKPEGLEKRSTKLLCTLYSLFSIINIGLAALFVFVDMHIMFYVLIAVGILFLELLIIYLHNHKFGDRIEISELERALMVALMCTCVIAVGGVFLGALISV